MSDELSEQVRQAEAQLDELRRKLQAEQEPEQTPEPESDEDRRARLDMAPTRKNPFSGGQGGGLLTWR